ncbi:DUF1681 domain-containing protein/Methyltransf_11 domain-containing protein [Cephalotus follicularis]|uniref:DUF1681 domain-containing protein/Methyltransf_11 domain-containing protein n=1 Tax=Cephalotus follicularis TaxID=3775 RepID=A0A1Q3AWL7_CEPFO|nr:DUF1681 domain-containing protein/Methyltransf_11 domain-containing protein [Cephalotus follicularis]
MAMFAPTHKLSLVLPKTGNAKTTSRASPRRRDSLHIVLRAVSSDVASYEEGQLERPKWAGETPLSFVVQSLISFKPLYSLLKLGARQVLISTAEKKNIPWREMTKEILESDVYNEMESIHNPSVEYPDYYLNPFHAYDEGNLSWLAAAEAEAATMSMVRRAIPYASSLDEANQIMRGNWLRAIEEHHLQYSGNSIIRDILDIGCSVGVSTRFLAEKFPAAKVTGLDLSPYFLAVANFNEKKRAPRQNPISWVHANGEDTGLPSKSFDLVSLAAVLHECPETATIGLIRETIRLLRPGGIIALTDQAPKSKILQIMENDQENADFNEETQAIELLLFQVSECYVYLIPPRKSAASYRADEWDVNKWAWEGTLKVVSKGEECIIRLEDKSTGELYAQAFLREGEQHPVESVIDSSRYFVLRIEENFGGRLRHAFIGIGFRERTEAYDFQAALHDHMKYLNKKKTAEEMEQQFQNLSSVDYSLKEGESLVLQLKNKSGHSLKSKGFEQGLSNLSLEDKPNPKEPIICIKPPPPPPGILSSATNVQKSPSNMPPSISLEETSKDKAPISIQVDSKELHSSESETTQEIPDDDFGDFQAAG